ncbi:unnamed protein product [Sphenostylis stenocarpa]|uniref:galactinol--sucrose galactosyltransferase n=1 Tax=Sphenostylis stenocarpa TaxID=92480 RepID=A0AA86SS17_9FABA|nr:unnamed protein product [Sphenostylis stenocarpa]
MNKCDHPFDEDKGSAERMSNSGRAIPIETQMLLLEARDGMDSQSSKEIHFNELELCVESGKWMAGLVRAQWSVATLNLMPGMLDCFGWCTWDAFYHFVNPQGIRDGLKRLSEVGTPAKFLITDDGWQMSFKRFDGRLISIKENNKFRAVGDVTENEVPVSLKDFVSEIKSNFGLKYVYVWHALLGYWGGLDPNASGTKKYDPKLRYPVQSPGNLANTRDLSIDAMEKYGIGIIDSAKISEFYDDLHNLHNAAEFHAVARAVGGCGVHCDKPGQHDFKVLKKLVLPDGSVLRSRYPGRPSRDCLFIDPVTNKKSLLKIWNLNKCGGVIGIFNCQGAGSWPGLESNAEEDIIFELSDFNLQSNNPVCTNRTNNMYNSGGAVEAVDSSDSSGSKIHVRGRGGGGFGAYSNLKPKSSFVNSEDLEFKFREEDNFFGVTISWDITICN